MAASLKDGPMHSALSCKTLYKTRYGKEPIYPICMPLDRCIDASNWIPKRLSEYSLDIQMVPKDVN